MSVSTTYPTNAAKIFKWGNAQWVDEFVDPLKSMWSVNRKSQVRNQHGMLTLEAPATGGDTVARLTGHGRQYGRWEARVRGRNYGTSGTAYHAVWELTPDQRLPLRRPQHRAQRLRTRHQQGRHARAQAAEPRLHGEQADWPSTNNQFHTYAIEVTPDHVSWFVDTKVIRTERRSAARTGATYNARFRLVGKPGAKMIPGRMQMDWVRYYTLDRPNAKPITAPQLTERTFAGAC